MELELAQIALICQSSELRQKVIEYLDDKSLINRPIEQLTSDEYGTVHDAAIDAWRNYSPELKRFEAEQDKGVYPIVIRGIEGVYFVDASEYPTMGPFPTLVAAEDYVRTDFGEFLLPGQE